MRDRLRAIESLVRRDGDVSADELARMFHVSTRTIRQDLLHLELLGHIARRRGGAFDTERDRPEAALERRVRTHAAEKRMIARVAAGLVHDGETIALDASSTALYLARELKRHRGWLRLRVVTNGLQAAIELGGVPGVKVFLLGGTVHEETLSTEMGLSNDYQELATDAAFVGAVGLTVQSGLFEGTHAEADVKARLLANTRRVVGVVDGSKWGQSGVAVFCPASRIAVLVADGGAPPALVRELEHAGVTVRLAYASGDGPGRGEG